MACADAQHPPPVAWRDEQQRHSKPQPASCTSPGDAVDVWDGTCQRSLHCSFQYNCSCTPSCAPACRWASSHSHCRAAAHAGRTTSELPGEWRRQRGVASRGPWRLLRHAHPRKASSAFGRVDPEQSRPASPASSSHLGICWPTTIHQPLLGGVDRLACVTIHRSRPAISSQDVHPPWVHQRGDRQDAALHRPRRWQAMLPRWLQQGGAGPDVSLQGARWRCALQAPRLLAIRARPDGALHCSRRRSALPLHGLHHRSA